MTAIFVILRKSIDGNELDEMASDPPDIRPSLQDLLQPPAASPPADSGPMSIQLPVIQ